MALEFNCAAMKNKLHPWKSGATPTRKDVLDTVVLVLEDAKVVFNKSVKRLYKPYKYTSKDELPSHRAAQAAGFRKDCISFLQNYVDSQLVLFFGGVDGLQDYYKDNREKIHQVLADGFVTVESKRRLNDNSVVHEAVSNSWTWGGMGGWEFSTRIYLWCIFLFIPIWWLEAIPRGIVWLCYLFRSDEYLGLRCLQTEKAARNVSVRLYAREDAVAILDQAINLIKGNVFKPSPEKDQT